MPQVYNNIYF